MLFSINALLCVQVVFMGAGGDVDGSNGTLEFYNPVTGEPHRLVMAPGDCVDFAPMCPHSVHTYARSVDRVTFNCFFGDSEHSMT